MTRAFSRILVPTDFGPESKAAFVAAASLARAVGGASIHLLHVVQNPTVSVGMPELHGMEAVRLRNNAVQEAHDRLEALSATLPDLRVTSYVSTGRPAERIVRIASDIGAHLIVMGTHGRSGLGRLLAGSVGEQVIRLAICPVMTVREFGAVRIASGEQAITERERAFQVVR